jgi:hypothetical protein
MATPTKCALCGRDPATGFATATAEPGGVDVRLCHGDLDPEPTCYMRFTGTEHVSIGDSTSG